MYVKEHNVLITFYTDVDGRFIGLFVVIRILSIRQGERDLLESIVHLDQEDEVTERERKRGPNDK